MNSNNLNDDLELVFAEKVHDACEPFNARVYKNELGLTIAVCEKCARRWTRVSQNGYMSVFRNNDERCDACETCFSSECKCCAEADAGDLQIQIRRIREII